MKRLGWFLILVSSLYAAVRERFFYFDILESIIPNSIWGTLDLFIFTLIVMAIALIAIHSFSMLFFDYNIFHETSDAFRLLKEDDSTEEM